MKATTINEAIKIAYDKIGDYKLDFGATANAGYPIYRSINNQNDYFCNLETRIEINYANGKSENIWIDSTPLEVAELKETIAKKDLEIIKLKAKLYDLLYAE